MNKTSRELAIAGILCAVGVVCSPLAIPVAGAKVFPVQHMVNVFSAIILGPYHGVSVAFVISLLRNLLGLGSLLAFPGSMFGALLAGVIYYKTKSTWLTYVAEIVGTGILGGLAAYPIAILFMGKVAGSMAFYVYVLPFLFSTMAGVVIAAVLIELLKRAGVLEKLRKS